jgi:hypothetical protein
VHNFRAKVTSLLQFDLPPSPLGVLAVLRFCIGFVRPVYALSLHYNFNMANALNALQLELQKFVPNYNKVLELIVSNPDVLREEGDFGRYVLHDVCSKGAPLEVVKECIKGNRDALQERSITRWYPLHFAWYNGTSESTIRTLVKEYPAATHEKDAIGLYPLHRSSKSAFLPLPLPNISWKSERVE